MIAATITVNAQRDLLESVLQGLVEDYRFSLVDAPGGRGIEIHASSDRLGQKRLKAELRQIRARIETGEIPTGASR